MRIILSKSELARLNGAITELQIARDAINSFQELVLGASVEIIDETGQSWKSSNLKPVKLARWLRTSEVSERIGIAEGTLRNWVYLERKTGELRGPRFFRNETGSVRYMLEDVEEYIARFSRTGEPIVEARAAEAEIPTKKASRRGTAKKGAR